MGRPLTWDVGRDEGHASWNLFQAEESFDACHLLMEIVPPRIIGNAQVTGLKQVAHRWARSHSSTIRTALAGHPHALPIFDDTHHSMRVANVEVLQGDEADAGRRENLVGPARSDLTGLFQGIK